MGTYWWRRVCTHAARMECTTPDRRHAKRSVVYLSDSHCKCCCTLLQKFTAVLEAVRLVVYSSSTHTGFYIHEALLTKHQHSHARTHASTDAARSHSRAPRAAAWDALVRIAYHLAKPVAWAQFQNSKINARASAQSNYKLQHAARRGPLDRTRHTYTHNKMGIEPSRLSLRILIHTLTW